MNRRLSCLAAAFAVLASSAYAQSTEMTAEELTNAFNQQKTRGLVIVPSAETIATGTEDVTVQQEEPTPAAVVDPTTDYVAAEAGTEVNVQIAFDFNSAALREDQKAKLDTLCQVMQNIDVSLFQIIGHTDSSGKASYNERLSLLRAQEVKRHLVNDCGIAEARLKAIGMGETAPLNTQNTRADENRRVEFQALG